MLREISEIDTKEFGIVKKPISLFNFAYPKPLKYIKLISVFFILIKLWKTTI